MWDPTVILYQLLLPCMHEQSHRGLEGGRTPVARCGAQGWPRPRQGATPVGGHNRIRRPQPSHVGTPLRRGKAAREAVSGRGKATRASRVRAGEPRPPRQGTAARAGHAGKGRPAGEGIGSTVAPRTVVDIGKDLVPVKKCHIRLRVSARACSSAEKKRKKFAWWSRGPPEVEGEGGKARVQQK
jgi:hypothetical protein